MQRPRHEASREETNETDNRKRGGRRRRGAGHVGAFLVVVYGFARRKVSLTGQIDALLETARTTGMINLILLGAEVLKIFMARGGVPMAAADAMISSGLSPHAILVVFPVALIILGCLMDSLSMILLAIPFFWTVISGLEFGIDEELVKIWFGIIALIVAFPVIALGLPRLLSGN